MPEGDTLHKIANRLGPVLVGEVVQGFEAPRLVGPRPRRGSRITAIEAVGKHLLIAFDDGVVLHTHLRMTGSWHLYERGRRWAKPAHLARVVIQTDDYEAVCFSAPVVRTTVGPTDAIAHLGPDLCRADADLDEVLTRMARIPDPAATIAEVLLDQRVAAGIGNMFKSEVLWAEGLDPATPVDQVAADLRRRLIETAARLLRANLTTPRRVTVPGGLAVYRRARRPCRRCGTPIRMARWGEQARSTYWCPRCQIRPQPAVPRP